MSLWELSAAFAGVAWANTPKGRQASAPSAEEHFAALKRIQEYDGRPH